VTAGSRVLVALRVDAPPDVTFRAFTEEIGTWWRPNGLFQFTDDRTGRLHLEPGVGGHLVETYADGTSFVIGTVRSWEPPRHLALSWRHASFGPDQETEVHVRFDAVDDQTRVTVEHHGWSGIPHEDAARHGFPLEVFQRRLAEHWQTVLDSMRSGIDRSSGHTR
jgi:uncharacterized protein YndB with AHSA1/START domain